MKIQRTIKVISMLILIAFAVSVSIAQEFKLEGGKIKSSATAISPADFSLGKAEHAYGESWLKNILTEMST